MDKNDRNLLIAVVVVVILLLILWRARETCRLGRYSKKGCPSNKGGFCGAMPDPAAASEAMGLYELGVRAGREGFGCGSTAAPAAMAEAQGLMQMGWRPEHLRTRPSCASPAPSAVAEAQALQHANALRPGAPYYQGANRSNFTGAPCGTPSAEALGEANILHALQATPDQTNNGSNLPGQYDVDGFATRKLSRDRAAFESTRARSENLRSNPAQTSARRARLDSMREGFNSEHFGGPDAAGYGWTPNAADIAASPATGGWGDAQSVGAAVCMTGCMDGCNGTNCADLCKDQCRQVSLSQATGVY